MRIEIDSVIRIYNYNLPVMNWCEENLILDNPTYLKLKRLGKDDTIKRSHCPEKIKNYVRRGDCLEIPFGCLYGIWNLIKDCNISLGFNDHKDISISNLKCPIELYDYQEPAVDYMVKAKGGILVSPCGSGKTTMGIEIIHRLGKRFLWVCHTKDLLKQAYSDFRNLYPNIDIGLTTEGKVDFGKDGTISTVQTLSKIDPKLYENEFDVVVVDECAHAVSTPTDMKRFGTVLGNIKARYKYGLTATPSRSDSLIESMYSLIGCARNGEFKPTYKIDKKDVKTIVAEHKMIPLDTQIGYEDDVYDIDGTIKYMSLIDFLSNNEERDEKILDNIEKCCKEGRKQVVLCLRVEHVEKMCYALNNRGINAVMVSGKTKSKIRESVLLLETEKWDVLVATYALLKEGINIKTLDTLHLTVPQKDKAMIVQCVGRIERYVENKKQPIVYDYVDENIPYCVKTYNLRRRAIKNRY